MTKVIVVHGTRIKSFSAAPRHPSPLNPNAVWAMLSTVSVAESSIGAVYHKGTLRLLGTIVGAVLGLGTLYFAVLCNGLNHENNPAKVCWVGESAACGIDFCPGCALSYCVPLQVPRSVNPPPALPPPCQFIVTTLCVTIVTGVIAMLDAWDPANVFGYMALLITYFGAALPGYSTDQIYWNYVGELDGSGLGVYDSFVGPLMAC